MGQDIEAHQSVYIGLSSDQFGANCTDLNYEAADEVTSRERDTEGRHEEWKKKVHYEERRKGIWPNESSS